MNVVLNIFKLPGGSCGLVLLLLLTQQSGAQEVAREPTQETQFSLVASRLEREKSLEDNPSVLVAHRRNYFLPVTWAGQPNNAPFEEIDDTSNKSLKQLEAQFQLSIKTSLASGLVFSKDELYIGFTVRSFWQAYSSRISAPFRETNYEPELFWFTPLPVRILGGDATLLGLGLSHQSNGRIQPLSRSWNRVYAHLIWERNRFVFGFKPWWRIPEDKKADPTQASGDDNPDIENYLGHFEFTTIYRKKNHEYSLMLRNNLDAHANKGALQFDYTFPVHGRARGYAQYFKGYGESLIDYDVHIERFGIGLLFSDLL